MALSTHYYVLSLSVTTNVLFEAFRDSLIIIQNQGFPVIAPAGLSVMDAPERLKRVTRVVDECFGHYYGLEPLKLVVVGEAAMQSAFRCVTAHGAAVIGGVDGDHTDTAARDLGQITWSVVKEAMSGVVGRALSALEAGADRGGLTGGLEAAAREASAGGPATLLVDDSYHRRGSLSATGYPAMVSPEVDVREAIDDAVDAVIEKVLQAGGNVVFVPRGSLKYWNQIVLLPGLENS